MPTYLNWLEVFVWLPTLILWATNTDVLLRYKKTLALCAFSALVFSIPWDVWAINSGIWSFPADKIIGIRFLGMPIEEYLFVVSVTVFIATLVLVLRWRLRNLDRIKKMKK